MQLLYGNDGINYHTIARTKEMTDIQEKELLAGYLGYEFVKDSNLYSAVDKEPISLTYVTTNLSKSLSEEKILFAINGRMTNYLTPSYWAHFQLFDMTQETYGDNFFNLLQSSFITDVEVNEYLHKDIDTFECEVRREQSINNNALDKDKIVVLVAAILNVADSLSRQVKVLLDVEGDLYNQRALEVIATVYKYIPFNVRKVAGFCTYAKADGSGSNRIKLLLYPREHASFLDKDVIDLKAIDIKREISRIPGEIVSLAREFVEVDDTTRMDWFHSFQSVFGLQTVSVEEHQTMFRNVRKWQNQELESIQDEIAVYAYKEQMKQSQTLVYRMFCNIMSKRFREENYDLKYSKLIKNLLEKQLNFQFSNQLNAYLALGEAVNCINFEWQTFEEWEQQKIITPLKAQYEEEALIAQYKEQFLQLHKIRAGGEKFARICLQMENLIKESVEEVYAEIKRRTEKEQKEIKNILMSKTFFLANVSEISNIYSNIKYKANCQVFAESLQINMKKYLDQIAYFYSYKEYCDYDEFLVKMQQYLTKDIFDELRGLIEQKGKVVKAMQQCRQIEWNHRNHILDSYQNVYIMQNLKQGKEVEVPDYVLEIEHQHFAMNEERLLGLMQFLLCPSESRSRAVRDLMLKEAKLLECLMHIEAFGAEHFSYLIRWCQDEIMQGKVINYYVNGTRLLSKRQVEEGLSGIDVYTLETSLSENDKLNILGISIKEKTRKRQANALKNEDTRFENVYSSSKKKRKKTKWLSIVLISSIAVIIVGLIALGVVFWIRG